MAKAIAFGRKRWIALTRYLEDGRLEIDNNIAERAMRCVALGRKNWLFAGSRAGGERAAAIYTIIETAAQWSRAKSLYRRRHRQDCWRLACFTLG